MRAAAVLLVVSLGVSSVHAAEAPVVPLAKVSSATVARGEPLPAWAEPLSPIPASTSRDALVHRLSEIQVSTGSGPTTVLYNRAIQINHRAGLGEIGQFGLSFLPSHQTLSLHRVTILRGDAVLDRTATVNARLLERESELDNGTYGGETTVQLLLDDVRVGDTLWVTWSVTGDNPVFGKHWGDLFHWDSNWPVALRRLTIRHPSDKPLYWRQLGDSPAPALMPAIERQGGFDKLRFEGRNLPAIQYEAKTPPGFIMGRMIQLSDFATWQEVAQWAGALFPPRPPSNDVTQLAAQFRTAGSQAAQAGAALRWVQDEIRYFSVSIGENSHRPQLPETVIARRYGDCKDKSYLLVSLLQALGIQAEPVLVNATAPSYPSKVQATQSAFDHAIVRLQLDGKTYFVDPTRTGQRGELAQLAPAFPGASVLVVSAATRGLTVLPEAPAGAPSYERIELFKVPDFSGAATLESREIFRASRAPGARRSFATMRPVEVANDVLEHYERQYPGVTLIGAPTLVDDAPDGSFEVRATLAVPAAVRKVEDRYVLDYDSQVADGTLGFPNKLVRQFPFSLPAGKLATRYRLRIQWPQAVRARVADAAHQADHPYFNVRETYSMLGNETDYLLDYSLTRDDVAAADLPGMQRAIRATQGMLTGSFNSNGTEDTKDDSAARDLSMRDFSAEQQLRQMRAAREEENADQIAEWNMAALCWHLRSATATWRLQTEDERARTLVQRDRFGDDARPGASACRGQLSLQNEEVQASVDWFAKETGLAPDDRVRLQWSWARWYAGQPALALSGAMAYIDAARASGTLNGSDLAMAISLHVRAGKPLPPALRTTYVFPADGPWPAPLLAWQRGTVSEAALFKTIAAYARDARALALNDAWFHVGQRRLASGDKAGAAAAWRWYQVDGVRATLPFVLAGLERLAVASRDRDLAAGNALAAEGKQAEAVAAWRRAAARGDIDAQALLGAALAEGRGVVKDIDAARRVLVPAAQAGSALAKTHLAYLEFFDERGDRAKGRAYLQEASALGLPQAMAYLSWIYHRGAATPPDASVEVELERQAAEMDHAVAQSARARRFLNGDQVTPNDDVARYWAQRSIVSGSDDGYAVLARLLMRGKPEDQRAALGMVRNLAAAGNAPAMQVMGHAAMRGIGQPVDLVAARDWYVRVRKKKEFVSLGQLGEVLADADHDEPCAFDVLRLAAEDGDARAQSRLGYLYRHGTGNVVDAAASLRWLNAAVRQGDLVAINNLGDAYETGFGVPRDMQRAMALYRQAALAGSPSAFSSLASVHEKGLGTRVDPVLAYTYLLLRQRFIAAARPGAVAEERTLAMAATLQEPQKEQARAVAQAWQIGQALPGDSR
jgi:TPR repeat protein